MIKINERRIGLYFLKYNRKLIKNKLKESKIKKNGNSKILLLSAIQKTNKTKIIVDGICNFFIFSSIIKPCPLTHHPINYQYNIFMVHHQKMWLTFLIVIVVDWSGASVSDS